MLIVSGAMYYTIEHGFDLVEIWDTGEMLRNLPASASYSETYRVFVAGALAMSTLDIMTS